ncbi:hypothetical protein [Mycolicibacterium austroafricanum]|uniref:hypothetical protein n=1 Tax=Mycolicibacterium austroafricanum TaxID=39687 RepID=UPI0005616C34|nr:hypothetical protein [Mycolicibacterium austroafricanum]
MTSVSVNLACTSASEDHAMLALRDLAEAAGRSNYRIIGGQMVYLLRHIYHHPGTPRMSADTDTGIDTPVAAGGDFHAELTRLGYLPECGNRYVRGDLAIDLLVPATGRERTKTIAGRAFDAAPGLLFALAVEPISVSVTARLADTSSVSFEVPIPDVEPAFVLKALARTVRISDNDVKDVGTLLEIVDTRPAYIATPWRMGDPDVVRSGQRGDAARAAARMSAESGIPARTRALLAHHVARP